MSLIMIHRLPVGACHRCKSLKVKCTFESEYEACKRCKNGGHDCFRPARRKRRSAAHRALLDQIREQVNDIGKLMLTLETENTMALQRASASGLLPSPSPTSTTTTLAVSEVTGPKILGRANSAVLEWIAKAKESWNALDDHITNTEAYVSGDGDDNTAYDGDEGEATAEIRAFSAAILFCFPRGSQVRL
jgi:hypothetical protein